MTDVNIDQLASLARLNVSSQEREKLTKGVAEVLDYVKKIQEVEIKEVTGKEQEVKINLREDVAILTSAQNLIDAFSERQGDLLKAPAISGKEKTYEA